MNTYTFFQCRGCKISFDSYDTAKAHDAAFGNKRPHITIRMNVTGTPRDDKRCTSSCVNATSGECECSCGGKDHGRYAA